MTVKSELERNLHVNLCMSRKKVKENTKRNITEYFKKKNEEVDTPTIIQAMEEMNVVVPFKEKQNVVEREKPALPPFFNRKKTDKPKKSKASNPSNNDIIDAKHSIRVSY